MHLSRASAAGNYRQKAIYDYLIHSYRVTKGNLFSERYASARENVALLFIAWLNRDNNTIYRD